MGKKVSAHRVKIHRQYTYEQASDELGVSIQTVRGWRKAGLHVLTGQKPHLILGMELKTFLKQRGQKAVRKLALDEFLCMACKGPRTAYGGMADYVAVNAQRGRLEALCGDCETPCGKFANPTTCAQLAGILTIAIRDARCP